MRHIDLFSGIGGFAYAAQQVWGDEYENVLFCEMNKYCQAVLRKNFGKDILIYDDIRKLTADTESGQSRITETRNRRENISRGSQDCFILTGGFPCQPFSQAGKRKGTDDDRYLWPEMLRVIKEFKPDWIIGENVAGITTMAEFKSGFELETKEYSSYEDARAALDEIARQGQERRSGKGVLQTIMDELEEVGYYVQPFIIPAVAVNAPHRRDRVWIIAYTNATGERPNLGECNRQGRYIQTNKGFAEEDKQKRNGRECWVGKVSPDATDPGRELREQRDGELSAGASERATSELHFKSSDSGHNVGNSYNTGSQGCGQHGECSGERSFRTADWEKDWRDVALATCDVRMDDGLPIDLDGLKLTKSKHRVERLKALGNAIVPQVAMQIMYAIKYADSVR